MSFRIPRSVAGFLFAVAMAVVPMTLVAQSRLSPTQGPVGQLNIGGTVVSIYAFSLGVENGVTTPTGGGIAALSDIGLVKLPDVLSTSLFRDALMGTHLPVVQIDVFQTGGTAIASSILLNDVAVTGFQTASGAQGEAVTLHFARVTLATGGTSFCWDVAANKQC